VTRTINRFGVARSVVRNTGALGARANKGRTLEAVTRTINRFGVAHSVVRNTGALGARANNATTFFRFATTSRCLDQVAFMLHCM
jgi:hypothetical protein